MPQLSEQVVPEMGEVGTELHSEPWSIARAQALIEQPFFDLLAQAHAVHIEHNPPNRLQLSQLLSIKTGRCPEDCAYCPQSAHYASGKSGQALTDVETVVSAARAAKAAGASRFCMGAAWRSPPKNPTKGLDQVCEMIRRVKAEGLETCVTLGMLNGEQADALHAAGLDFYNHNLDTSPEFYRNIITTRTFEDRLDTLRQVHKAGIRVCTGGILGMGETREDRMHLLVLLANWDPVPESVPINQLIPIPGTPLGDAPPLDPFEFIRTVAVARIMMPQTFLRLSAGREQMDESVQAWCFFAGANSIFFGETLLTAKNPTPSKDRQLMEKLGLQAQTVD